MRSWSAAIVLFCAAAGCQSDSTQVMVVIDADLEVRGRVVQLKVEVEGGAGTGSGAPPGATNSRPSSISGTIRKTAGTESSRRSCSPARTG